MTLGCQGGLGLASSRSLSGDTRAGHFLCRETIDTVVWTGKTMLANASLFSSKWSCGAGTGGFVFTEASSLNGWWVCDARIDWDGIVLPRLWRRRELASWGPVKGAVSCQLVGLPRNVIVRGVVV